MSLRLLLEREEMEVPQRNNDDEEEEYMVSRAKTLRNLFNM